jgi:hypothetical protein
LMDRHVCNTAGAVVRGSSKVRETPSFRSVPDVEMGRVGDVVTAPSGRRAVAIVPHPFRLIGS